MPTFAAVDHRNSYDYTNTIPLIQQQQPPQQSMQAPQQHFGDMSQTPMVIPIPMGVKVSGGTMPTMIKKQGARFPRNTKQGNDEM